MLSSGFCVRKAWRKFSVMSQNMCSISEQVRLNKYLSEIGICSRRVADRMIRSRRVTVNSEVAALGAKVNVIRRQVEDNCTDKRVQLKTTEEIAVDGRVLQEQVKGKIYLALNKPVGIVCTTDRSREKNNIIDFVNYPTKDRIFHIGRLDKPSSGLILLTNDGDIVNKILRAQYNHEKEYIVLVNKPLTRNVIKWMSDGVPLFDGTVVTKKCTIEQIDETSFRIVLTQGLNRQIRRMCEYFNYEVISLKRIRIMNIALGTLRIGQCRELTAEEVSRLFQDLHTENRLAE